MTNNKSPVSIDNVTYLNRIVPQDVLCGIASAYINEVDLDVAILKFNAVLARQGRPHGDAHVSTCFGIKLIDLIANGDGILRRALWFKESGDPAVIEAHGTEISGWWFQAAEDVLLHVPFGKGLTILETACALAESPLPPPELVSYLQSLFAKRVVDDDFLSGWQRVTEILPTEIQQYLGASFQCGHRIASISFFYSSKKEDRLRIFDFKETWTALSSRHLIADH